MKALKVVGLEKGVIVGILAFHIFSTVFESIGLSMLLPLFQLMQSHKTAAELAAQSTLWRILTDVYAVVGLVPNIPSLMATSFVSICARQIFVYCRLNFIARVKFMLLRRLREQAFSEFLGVRLGYVEEEGLGRIVNEMTIETQVAVETAINYVSMLGLAMVGCIYLGLLFFMSPIMTVAAIVVVILAIVPITLLMREGRDVSRQIVSANSELLAFVSERLRSIRLVRLSEMAAAEETNMSRHTDRQFDRYMRGFILRSRSTVLMEPIVAAAAFGFVYLGVNQLNLPLEQVALFLVILLRLAPLVKQLVTVRFAITSRVGSAEQIERRLAGLRSNHEKDTGQVSLTCIEKGIGVEHVWFRYPNRAEPALRDINIFIPAHKITALVGPSGGGKSTLIDLLPRLREPDEGAVLFDGIPAPSIMLKSLRDAISYAPQSPQIFDVTPREHISYGRHGTHALTVEEAARLSGAHEFIMKLPNGYNTRLGEGGDRLSGGQRQRLDLARALLACSPLLILDEPTSQLDSESEYAFREALKRIRARTQMTVIVVAHRLSTVSIADQIIVMRNACVEQFGTHHELITRGGWYAAAFEKQGSTQQFEENKCVLAETH